MTELQDTARRLIAAATTVMPPSRRDWGRALSAELDYAHTRGDQVRLVLGAVRVVLLPPPGLLGGLRGYGRTAGTSAALAAIAYVPLGAGLYESNVVDQSGAETTAGALAMGAYLILILMTAGVLARRASPRVSRAITAGLVAGAILGVLEMATFAWLDHAFFSVISQQPEKIEGFRESGLTSMHAYLNASLESSLIGVILTLAIMGAVLAPIGAALSAHAAEARSHLRRLI